MGAALSFIGLRVYVRVLRRQSPTLSDALVLLAWLAFVSCCACDVRLNQLGLFSPGRTYEQPLTNINPDPEKSIEALKVSLPAGLLLIIDHLRFCSAILYGLMAH